MAAIILNLWFIIGVTFLLATAWMLYRRNATRYDVLKACVLRRFIRFRVNRLIKYKILFYCKNKSKFTQISFEIYFRAFYCKFMLAKSNLCFN